MSVTSDEAYMRRALALAARGVGRTSPNPAVGAVVVRGGRIVGEGYHRRAGEPHAEVIALRNAGPRARGATLYVTLEPCCHVEKRTPPCVDMIEASGIRTVVVATGDPNPKVAGRGVARLRSKGLTVRVGVLRERATRLNEAYAHWITTGRPFVTLKVASTLDGKIAAASGESRWITGPRARDEVHRLRSRVDAVLVGLGTVKADDPELTARGGRNRRNPHRVILDERLAVPPIARAVRPRQGSTAFVVATPGAAASRRRRLESVGARVLIARARDGVVDLRDLMRRLGAMAVTSILIEGGSEVNASALRAGIVTKVMIMLAPKILGGRDAVGSVGGRSPRRLSEAARLRDLTVRRAGDDVIVEGYL
ncbi:MAG: bifunctional diaminohydroxyphosphoribosylaminopyrimidine deaminase/5-amino-6-(5-phosphoribosylamino)uracil reductase RibD [Nitrospirota bacterium]